MLDASGQATVPPGSNLQMWPLCGGEIRVLTLMYFIQLRMMAATGLSQLYVAAPYLTYYKAGLGAAALLDDLTRSPGDSRGVAPPERLATMLERANRRVVRTIPGSRQGLAKSGEVAALLFGNTKPN